MRQTHDFTGAIGADAVTGGGAPVRAGSGRGASARTGAARNRHPCPARRLRRAGVLAGSTPGFDYRVTGTAGTAPGSAAACAAAIARSALPPQNLLTSDWLNPAFSNAAVTLG